MPADTAERLSVLREEDAFRMGYGDDALRLLALEEAAAWKEYLASTTGRPLRRYLEVEPWAWARLAVRLRAIRTRRTKLAKLRPTG